MKELIYIFTGIGERLEEILRIVGDTLVGTEDIGGNTMVSIEVSEEEWRNRIKPQIEATRC